MKNAVLCNNQEYLKWICHGQRRAGTDVISHSDPWHARMELMHHGRLLTQYQLFSF